MGNHRPSYAIGAAMLLLLSLVPISAAEGATLYISEVHPIPANGDSEFVEIHNPTGQPVQLQNWSILDAASTGVVFPAFELPAYGSVLVWGSQPAGEPGFNANRPTWLNNGDETLTLRNPAGEIVSQITYGPASANPSPASGESIHFEDAPRYGAPTPGYVVQNQGSMTASVLAFPPEIGLGSRDDEVAVGATQDIVIGLLDLNDDIASWTISDQHGGNQYSGASAFDHQKFGFEFLVEGPNVITIYAIDQTGLEDQVNFTVNVVRNGLGYEFPSGTQLNFGSLIPGENATAVQTIRITNHDLVSYRPIFDANDLSNGNQSIALVGHLEIHITKNGTTDVIPYTGPLQDLGELGGGESVVLAFELRSLPDALAPGVYRTTYALNGAPA